MSSDVPGVRILMVLENNPYPFDQRVRAQAETLAAAGYRVSILCPADSGQPRREVIADVSVQRFPAPRQGRGMGGYLWEFGYGTSMLLLSALTFQMREGFDVLHAFGPPDTVFTVGSLAKLLGKKFVFDHRDLSPELYVSKFGKEGGALHRALLLMEKSCCKQADLLIAPNESYRALEIARHGIPEGRIAIVRNGPRLQEFTEISGDSLLRAKAPFILGYVGHMSTQDGIDYLLRSLHHLKRVIGRSDFYCVLIGPMDDPEGLRNLASDLGVEEHVWFAGKMPFGAALLRYLSTADIFVEPAPSNPLNDKSTMTKIMEYMALAKPIVAYDLPENHVSAGQAALFAQSNDEADFASKIATLMDAPDLRREMGAYGQKRVAEALSWDYSAARLLEAYRALLSGASRKGFRKRAMAEGEAGG